MRIKGIVNIVLLATLLFILGYVGYQKISSSISETASSTQPVVVKTKHVGLSNPASTRCSDLGGKLSIQKLPYGSQYGLCYFEDNKACEEWALFRGECPVGGVKTTGFDTLDQKYCAWRGGKTIAEASSTCTFRDGKSCSTIDYYNGKCEGL